MKPNTAHKIFNIILLGVITLAITLPLLAVESREGESRSETKRDQPIHKLLVAKMVEYVINSQDELFKPLHGKVSPLTQFQLERDMKLRYSEEELKLLVTGKVPFEKVQQFSDHYVKFLLNEEVVKRDKNLKPFVLEHDKIKIQPPPEVKQRDVEVIPQNEIATAPVVTPTEPAEDSFLLGLSMPTLLIIGAFILLFFAWIMKRGGGK